MVKGMRFSHHQLNQRMMICKKTPERDKIDFIFFYIYLLPFSGVFGKGKCGCPCRDYYVPKCEITYVQQCYTEHYEQVTVLALMQIYTFFLFYFDDFRAPIFLFDITISFALNVNLNSSHIP